MFASEYSSPAVVAALRQAGSIVDVASDGVFTSYTSQRQRGTKLC